MISDVLNSVAGMEFFPIIGLFFFLIAFLAVIIWVFRLDKQSIHRWSRIPLDNGTTSDSQGGHDHE